MSYSNEELTLVEVMTGISKEQLEGMRNIFENAGVEGVARKLKEDTGLPLLDTKPIAKSYFT